jgi:hypothetical protein
MNPGANRQTIKTPKTKNMKFSFKSFKFRHVFLLISIASTHQFAFCDGEISAFEGVYIMPGKATSQQTVGGKNKKVKNATDCLAIRKLSNDKMEIYLSSIQERGYSCYLEGEAELINKRLVFYTHSKEEGVNHNQGVYIDSDGKHISFSPIPGTASDFCGIHASLHGLIFDTKKKAIPWDTKTPKTEELLSQHCPKWNQ